MLKTTRELIPYKTKFSRLTFISLTEKTDRIICQCDCGATKDFYKYDVFAGKSKSCGCFRSEYVAQKNFKHGDVGSKEHTAWLAMKQRCSDPNYKNYHCWGGRGITVCDRWLNSYENFLTDMGRKPSSQHSLDRIDNNGNYCPENCRWTSRFEQHRNKNNNFFITFNGETLILEDWARRYNLASRTVSRKIKKNIPLEQIFVYR